MFARIACIVLVVLNVAVALNHSQIQIFATIFTSSNRSSKLLGHSIAWARNQSFNQVTSIFDWPFLMHIRYVRLITQ